MQNYSNLFIAAHGFRQYPVPYYGTLVALAYKYDRIVSADKNCYSSGITTEWRKRKTGIKIIPVWPRKVEELVPGQNTHTENLVETIRYQGSYYFFLFQSHDLKLVFTDVYGEKSLTFLIDFLYENFAEYFGICVVYINLLQILYEVCMWPQYIIYRYTYQNSTGTCLLKLTPYRYPYLSMLAGSIGEWRTGRPGCRTCHKVTWLQPRIQRHRHWDEVLFHACLYFNLEG
jgi:hypothetical protein